MGKLNIKSIITEEFENKVQNSFACSTGYGIVFVDSDGNHIGDGSNFTDFCRCINSTPKGRAACAHSNKQGFGVALKTHKPCIYICHAGLINIVIPFRYHDEYIGALTAGQVLCDDTDYFMKCDEYLLDKWMEEPKLKENYKKIATYPKEKIEAMTYSLENIQNYIFRNYLNLEIERSYAENKRQLLLYENKQIELEHQLKVSQLEMLQKKIIPHFMFNVINSISRLISLGEDKKALKMLDAFSKMMRYQALNATLMVTLEEELNYIENYLSIQSIRFGERLQYEISCDSGIKNFKIPFFSLQPFVENSMEHGILNKEDGGCVKIICSKLCDRVRLVISDNGIGIEPLQLNNIACNILTKSKRPPDKHVGMFNCYNRYKVAFDDKADIKIESKLQEGTKITVDILTDI